MASQNRNREWIAFSPCGSAGPGWGTDSPTEAFLLHMDGGSGSLSQLKWQGYTHQNNQCFSFPHKNTGLLTPLQLVTQNPRCFAGWGTGSSVAEAYTTSHISSCVCRRVFCRNLGKLSSHTTVATLSASCKEQRTKPSPMHLCLPRLLLTAELPVLPPLCPPLQVD